MLLGPRLWPLEIPSFVTRSAMLPCRHAESIVVLQVSSNTPVIPLGSSSRYRPAPNSRSQETHGVHSVVQHVVHFISATTERREQTMCPQAQYSTAKRQPCISLSKRTISRIPILYNKLHIFRECSAALQLSPTKVHSWFCQSCLRGWWLFRVGCISLRLLSWLDRVLV